MMSYDVYAIDENGKTIQIDTHNFIGGTYQSGGTSAAWLNVTYNYAKYLDVIHKKEGLRYLDGKRIFDTLQLLSESINKLGNEIDEDYWKCTEGNVKIALIYLVNIGIRAVEKCTYARWSVI